MKKLVVAILAAYAGCLLTAETAPVAVTPVDCYDIGYRQTYCEREYIWIDQPYRIYVHGAWEWRSGRYYRRTVIRDHRR